MGRDFRSMLDVDVAEEISTLTKDIVTLTTVYVSQVCDAGRARTLRMMAAKQEHAARIFYRLADETERGLKKLI